MSEEMFQILVNGTLTEGAMTEQVKQNIAKLFKTSVDKVEPMFSGRKMAVKKGLDKETALKYKAAINKAGLAAAVAPMTSEAAADTGNDTSSTSLDNASLAATGSTMDETPAAAPANIDTSDLVMDSVGETLAEATPPPKPDINIDQISMGEVGEDVTEYTLPPEPDIDISKLDMGETGDDVMQYEAVPDANIDISELSMADAGEDVMQHKEVPPADIDTSNLKLD